MAKKRTKTKAESTAKAAVNFEESIEALKLILDELESGQLPLSKSLEKYESGIGHLRNCHETLQTARQKIELLVRVDKDGQPITQPFDDKATYTEDIKGDGSILDDDAEQDLQDELDELQDEGGLF